MTVESAGTSAQALAPIAGVNAQLMRFGLVSPQRVGRQIEGEFARAASLIVTAEADHVVWIAGRWPELFSRTFTLLELAEYGERLGPTDSLAEGLDEMKALRPSPRSYLDGTSVPSIVDPTGGPPAVWSEVADQIDQACQRIATWLP